MNSSLLYQDPQIAEICAQELRRQQNQLEMIASENFTSKAVMEAQGSALTNKYAEGYPGKRYYGGCEFVDQAEQLAIDRAKQLFQCPYVNVQPHSGSQANIEVFYALLNPGDTILGMSLDSGGHLTHGARVSFSGKWFNAIGYSVKPDTGLIDYDQVRELAHAHCPRLIIAGASAYPRQIDFQFFRDVAQEIGAYFMVDMAHIAGLVAGGALPSPLPYADVVTTTTHKTLRGPRGGMILAQTENLAKKLNSAVFPGNQGGPLMHVIAAKAVAFAEALRPEFKHYAQQIICNAQMLSATLQSHDIPIVTQGTDCHLVLVDLRSLGISGKFASETLEQAGITCNKNSVPFDQASPQETSGIRLGAPALTTRGLKESEFQQIGGKIARILTAASSKKSSHRSLETQIQEVNDQVQDH